MAETWTTIEGSQFVEPHTGLETEGYRVVLSGGDQTFELSNHIDSWRIIYMVDKMAQTGAPGEYVQTTTDQDDVEGKGFTANTTVTLYVTGFKQTKV